MARGKGKKATVEVVNDGFDLDELAKELENLGDLGDLSDISSLDDGDDVDIEDDTEGDDEPDEDILTESKPAPKPKAATGKGKSISKPAAPPPQVAQEDNDEDDPKVLLMSAIKIQRKVVSKSGLSADAKRAALDQLDYVEGLVGLLL